MRPALFLRTSLTLAIGTILCAPARALITFDDGRDHIYVSASAGMTYDTNVFGNQEHHSDVIYSGGVGIEYARKAGIIAVDASAGISHSHFGKFTSEDFSNPHFQGEFSAKDDRTAADLTLAAARQSQPEVVTGTRALEWDYSAGFNTKYRVNDRYSVAGNLGYATRDITNDPSLVDLHSYTAGASLFYSINSARDLFFAYNFGRQETSRIERFDSHSFTIGVDGKILPKLNGSIQLGYAMEVPHGNAEHSTGMLTESVSLTWNMSRRNKMTGNLSQSFNATANDESVSTTSGSLVDTFAVNSKLALDANVGAGYSRYLGAAAGGRRDTYFAAGCGAEYTLNDHFKVSLDYEYFQNWSTFTFTDFVRNTLSLNVSMRY